MSHTFDNDNTLDSMIIISYSLILRIKLQLFLFQCTKYFSKIYDLSEHLLHLMDWAAFYRQ
jgi:hypothetical protein